MGIILYLCAVMLNSIIKILLIIILLMIIFLILLFIIGIAQTAELRYQMFQYIFDQIPIP